MEVPLRESVTVAQFVSVGLAERVEDGDLETSIDAVWEMLGEPDAVREVLVRGDAEGQGEGEWVPEAREEGVAPARDAV